MRSAPPFSVKTVHQTTFVVYTIGYTRNLFPVTGTVSGESTLSVGLLQFDVPFTFGPPTRSPLFTLSLFCTGPHDGTHLEGQLLEK